MQTSQTATATRSPGSVTAESMISHIRELSATLQDHSPEQLAAEARSIRSEVALGTSIIAPEIQVAGISLALEAMRRSIHVTLYDQQLLAVIQLTRGHIVQMQTGEGKTFAAIATAGHLALAGKGVHVMTPNSYLAERDCQTAKTVLQPLHMTVGQTVEQADPADKQTAYECDVTYGTGHEFGFDYLRDQLTLRQQAETRLGGRLLQDLRTADQHKRSTMQRGLQFAVVDEADSVLIDDAGSPLVLSMFSPDAPPDLQAHLVAYAVADVLTPAVDFEYQSGSGSTALTTTGKARCYADDIAIPTNVLLRPWTAYVEQALRAKYQFRRNVHYAVLEDQVKIVDASTGRIFEDRSWQDGLHQAIEAREGLPVTSEKAALARITRQRFFRLYQNLCGMTGTATGCESELKHVYRVTVQEIPLRLPSARTLLPLRCFATLDHKHAAIVQDIDQRYARLQPVLVGTQSITDSEAIAKHLQDRKLPFELLNGLQTAEEAHIIAAAGQPGAITISTNLAGRGTDIDVPPAALQTGGLHVIVAECQLSGRMDRQLIGRCARQGQPGSAQMFVSADDALLMRFGEWLCKAIRREAGSDGEAMTDVVQPLKRLQMAAEKQQFLMRAELLRQDLSRDVLFGSA